MLFDESLLCKIFGTHVSQSYCGKWLGVPPSPNYTIIRAREMGDIMRGQKEYAGNAISRSFNTDVH